LIPLEGASWRLSPKTILLLIALVLASNWLTYTLFVGGNNVQEVGHTSEGLYLLDQAKPYLYDATAFEKKVRKVSYDLAVPPEWLMAVMHSESRFDASVANHKGSGATGLIQWMPATAKDMKVTVEKLRNMNHVQQLDYVYTYLNQKRKQYHDYRSLTDVYLAILYPKAMGENYCYTLYAAPSKEYEMNKGLDINKDKRVTVQDIDERMKKKYKTAYQTENTPSLYRRVVTSLSFGQ
ncbi:MAG: transglycosylase SLT domain-containing protein, partial [Chitinophagales bacterium]